MRRSKRRRSSIFGGHSLSIDSAKQDSIIGTLPSARLELEALTDPTDDFDWHFLGEVLGQSARDRRTITQAREAQTQGKGKPGEAAAMASPGQVVNVRLPSGDALDDCQFAAQTSILSVDKQSIGLQGAILNHAAPLLSL